MLITSRYLFTFMSCFSSILMPSSFFQDNSLRFFWYLGFGRYCRLRVSRVLRLKKMLSHHHYPYYYYQTTHSSCLTVNISEHTFFHGRWLSKYVEGQRTTTNMCPLRSGHQSKHHQEKSRWSLLYRR